LYAKASAALHLCTIFLAAFAENMRVVMICSSIIACCLILGQLLRYYAHSKYELRPHYWWRIQLYAAMLALPFNWIISVFIRIDLFLQKDF
jgi:hypothetical protein